MNWPDSLDDLLAEGEQLGSNLLRVTHVLERVPAQAGDNELRSMRTTATRFDPRRGNQAGGSSRLAWNSAKYLANIASVSITSVKPACISLMVDTIAGGPGLLRP
jgi:hypothetical protein